MVDSFNYGFENGEMSISQKRGIISLILQAKKFLKCDWLRPVVFLPNLKYLHVKISVSMET